MIKKMKIILIILISMLLSQFIDVYFMKKNQYNPFFYEEIEVNEFKDFLTDGSPHFSYKYISDQDEDYFYLISTGGLSLNVILNPYKIFENHNYNKLKYCYNYGGFKSNFINRKIKIKRKHFRKDENENVNIKLGENNYSFIKKENCKYGL